MQRLRINCNTVFVKGLAVHLSHLQEMHNIYGNINKKQTLFYQAFLF
jgi:hypothetical protein